nr:probable cytochrome P450 313a4 isoform X1 [Aedes albopictus]
MWWLLLVPYLMAGVVVVYSYVQWTRRKMYAMLATMSGPKTLPVIGHAHEFYNVTPGEFRNHQDLNCSRTYAQISLHTEGLADTLRYFGSFPSPVCIHMGPLPHVGVFDPESVQAVLNSQHCLQKSHQYSFLWIPHTIIASPVHMWKGQRKAMNPSFGPANLGSYVPIFNNKCVLLMDILQQHVGKPERDFTRDIMKCTLDQIYETAYECEFNMQLSPDGDKSMDLFENFMALVAERFFTVWKYPDFIYSWTKAYRDQKKYITTYFDTVLEKIERHVDMASKIKDMGDASSSGKRQNYVNCLAKYLRSQGPIPREELLAHLGLMVFAGNETTAKTINAALLLLAIHPEIQERCYQEITSVCPGENEYISAEDAAKLTYLEMVIKESMRLFPVAAILARFATDDVKINDHQTIPKNTRIIIGTYQIHRDPKIWGPNADQFDPDHFLPENVAGRHPYSFIPFSGGPRNCMGIRYAWLSMKILIAFVLRQYRLSTTVKYDELKVAYGVLLSISNGCPMTIEKRAVG